MISKLNIQGKKMQKTISSLVLLAAVLLASCAPQPTVAPTAITAPTATSAPVATATNTVAPAPTLAADQESKIPTQAADATNTPAGPKCETFSLLDKILIPTEKEFPAVSDTDWVLGNPTAANTIIEYSDFQCPYCSQMEPLLDQLVKAYPQEIRVVYRHLPLAQIHSNAELAAQAAEAAGKQGKFPEMYKALFENQETWSGKSADEFKTWLTEQAKTLNLKVDQFTTDLTSDAIVAKIKKAEKDAEALAIPGTPYLIINGKQLQVNPSIEVFDAIIALTKFKEHQFTKCPDTVVDPSKKYTATITTDQGDIVVDLLLDKAPIAVNSFVFLAQSGYYDNSSFHRVVADFVAQGGDPSGTGFGGPGYAFTNEISSDLKFDQAGLVGMANSGADGTNGSQFFITYGALPKLDGKYTIFGKVTSGMDVAKKLTLRDPSKEGKLPTASIIKKITIEEK
jgi:cyclophilin family peptidyl-prolyl cis-trans isomerase/protein-disulfide isomerase